jgi:hydroxymethylbilane synthase
VGEVSLIRVGTRGSPLALVQTALVEAALAEAGCTTERTTLRTTGDVIRDVPLEHIGTTAIFTRELDDALLDGRIDAAVHSLKDLPTRLPEGVIVAAVGPRENPADVFVSTRFDWQDVPVGAVVATSSVRRRAELLRARPDLEVVSIRGNIDTRLEILEATPSLAGTVLAAAGLIRLSLQDRIRQYFMPEVILPAPGQGAVAVTVREADHDTLTAVRCFHDAQVAAAVQAERSLLRALDGGCQVPIGALAQAQPEGEGWRVELRARVVSLDGRQMVDEVDGATIDADEGAETLGLNLADRMRRLGAESILRDVRAAPSEEV